MPADRLHAVLARHGVELTTYELAEAIWLAVRLDLGDVYPGLGGGVVGDASPAPAGGHGSEAAGRGRVPHLATALDDEGRFDIGLPAQAEAREPASGPGRSPPDGTATASGAGDAAPDGAGTDGAATGGDGARGAATGGDGTGGDGTGGVSSGASGRPAAAAPTGRPLRVPTASALPRTLDLLRALRPLKRRVPSRHTREVDEEQTAIQAAERRVWVPAWKPSADRWLDLTLVLDQSGVGDVWGRLGIELQTLFERFGAFRTIRVRHLHARPDGTVGVAVQADPRRARLQPPTSLLGAPHDQLVLVVSDCVSGMWRSGAVGRVLERWARRAPVAVLQPLPEHLWDRTGLAPTPGRLRGSGAGGPAAGYAFTPRPRRGCALPGGSVPVPVLEIDSDWLRPWAAMVAGSAANGGAVYGIEAVVTAADGRSQAGPAPHARSRVADAGSGARDGWSGARDGGSGAPDAGSRAAGEPSAAQLVSWFRADASPSAFQLARYLTAAVPLNLAVMRVVQAVMLSEFRPSHLAEVVYSGLLRAVDAPGAAGTADDRQYEFVPGVRDLLMDTLRQDDGWRVFTEVSRYLEERIERAGASFSAVVSAPVGGLVTPPLRQPFAQVRAHVLRRLSLAGPTVEAVPRVPGTLGAPGRPGGAGELLALRESAPGHTRDAPDKPSPGGSGRRPGRLRPLPPRGRAVILHLTGPRLAAAVSAGGGWGDPGNPAWPGTRLLDDLERLRRREGIAPDLVAVTGDLTVRAMPSEYEAVHEYLEVLRRRLGLQPDRMIVVPGMHDVNELRCKAYFLDREADGESPVPPYWPKWEPFAAMLRRLGGATLQRHEPWLFTELAELRMVVAGLNSTIAVSHLEQDRYGWLGGPQLRWFADRMRGYERRGWLRLAVLHHDPTVDNGTGAGRLRDAEDFTDVLAPHLDLVLHGYPGAVREVGVTGVPAVGVARPGVAHQLVDVRPGTLRILARGYDEHRHAWSGEPAAYGYGDHWWLPSPGASSEATAGGAATGAGGATGAQDGTRGTRSDLTARVAEVYRVRDPAVSVTEHPWPAGREPGDLPPAPGLSYLLVSSEREHGWGDPTCVGVCDGAATLAIVQRFVDEVARPFRGGRSAPDSLLIARDDPNPRLRDLATGRGVRLVGFAEFQLGEELVRYAEHQADRLAGDPAYPPEWYLPQRYVQTTAVTEAAGGQSADQGQPSPGEQASPVGQPSPGGEPSPDALDGLSRWLATPGWQAVAVLGASGVGKTFLLRQLVRRLHADRDRVVPILVDLRDMDWTFGIDQLITVQLPRGEVPSINLTMIRYLLREGRVVLLCDGLDELAATVDRARLRTRWGVLTEVAAGAGKIVLASRDPDLVADIFGQPMGEERTVAAAGGRTLELVGFDPAQIAEYLDRRLGGPAAARARLGLLERAGGLLGMCRVPRLLAFIAGIDGERLRDAVSHSGRDALSRSGRDAASRSGAVTLAELYGELITYLLRLEQRRRLRHAAAIRVSTGHLWQAVTLLALRLWESGETALDADALGAAADVLARLSAVAPVGRQRPSRREVARLLATSSLLVRQRGYRFAFVDDSVPEWLVARALADRLGTPGGPAPLHDPLHRDMSELMIEFLCDLAGAAAARRWANSVVTGPGLSAGIHHNALRVLRHLDERRAAGSPQPGTGRDRL